MIRLLTLALFLLAGLGAHALPARADCTTLSGHIATPGEFMYNVDYGVMQYCAGTIWRGVGGAAGTDGPLANLTDVDDALAPADGDCLVYNNGTSQWETGACGSGGGGGSFSCPSGFTALTSQGQTLGCMQDAVEAASGTNCKNAATACFNTYGARLPSYSEYRAALSGIPGFTIHANTEWVDSAHYDSGGDDYSCGQINSSANPDGADYALTSLAYRCFIPAGANGGGGGGASNLVDLGDVDAAGMTGGECLVYNNGTGKWEDGACAAGGGDNLGDHTATQDIDLATNDILNAGNINTTTASILGGPLTVDNNTDGTNKGCIRFNGTSNKLEFSHDCAAYSEMGSGSGGGSATIVRTAFNQVLGAGSNAFTATGCLAGDLVLLGDAFFNGTRLTPTIDGVAATLIDAAEDPNEVAVYWGVAANDNPSIVWNYSVAPDEGPVISWVCYSGADISNPVRASAIDETGDSTVSLTLNGLTAGDMAHLFAAGWNDDSLTATGDLTSLQVSPEHNGGTVGAHGYAEVTGSSVTLGYSAGNDLAIVGFAIKPGGVSGSGGDDLGDHTATQALDMATFKVIGMGMPTAGTDAATKAYVDGLTGANETDPQLGTLTEGKWCYVTGGVVDCTQDPPGGGITGHEIVQVNSAGSAIINVDCPGGKKLLGGGCNASTGSQVAFRSYPVLDNRWHCTFTSVSSFNKAYAICADIP